MHGMHEDGDRYPGTPPTGPHQIPFFRSAKELDEWYERNVMCAWPTLYWGLEGIADDGFFWFQPRRDVMGADILYVTYWGA